MWLRLNDRASLRVCVCECVCLRVRDCESYFLLFAEVVRTKKDIGERGKLNENTNFTHSLIALLDPGCEGGLIKQYKTQQNHL